MALSMRALHPVRVDKRKLTFGVGELLSVDHKRLDFVLPLRVSASRSSLGVPHAPRFHGGDHPFAALAAAFAGDVFQQARLDIYVQVTLLIRGQWGVAGPCTQCSALGRLITAKNGYDSRSFDYHYHIIGRRRTPDECAPNPQQYCKGELDEVPEDTRAARGGMY